MSLDYEYINSCENCGHLVKFMIPFGMSVKVFLNTKNTVCSRCGCESVAGKNHKSINEQNDNQKELLHD